MHPSQTHVPEPFEPEGGGRNFRDPGRVAVLTPTAERRQREHAVWEGMVQGAHEQTVWQGMVEGAHGAGAGGA